MQQVAQWDRFATFHGSFFERNAVTKWLASNFFSQYHQKIILLSHEYKGSDLQRKELLICKQLVITIGYVQRTLWRIYILMLMYKYFKLGIWVSMSDPYPNLLGPVIETRSNPNRGSTQAVGLGDSLEASLFHLNNCPSTIKFRPLDTVHKKLIRC